MHFYWPGGAVSDEKNQEEDMDQNQKHEQLHSWHNRLDARDIHWPSGPAGSVSGMRSPARPTGSVMARPQKSQRLIGLLHRHRVSSIWVLACVFAGVIGEVMREQ